MSGLTRFLAAVEKSFIIISICSFIPITVLVFTIRDPVFTPAHLSDYELAYQQVRSAFIIKFKELDKNQFCSFREALLNNEYCFERYWDFDI